MNKFNAGDRIRLIKDDEMSAKIGAEAVVIVNYRLNGNYKFIKTETIVKEL